MIVDDYDGIDLDRSVWLPHYLPAWSSKAETAAAYEVADSCLRLFIPPSQGLWMGAEHDPPLRVSGIQTGNFSGPAGSALGQQPLDGGSVVREPQERFEGFLPLYGELSMRARMTVSPRSMAAWWMSGFEDRPERCGEICVFEVFGDAVEPGRSAAVGMGLKPFRDPRVADDFAAPRLPVDVAGFHEYAVRWTREEAVFSVDGAEVRRCPRPPDYPLQTMLAVFDFPDRSDGADDGLVPELVVDRLRWDHPGGPG